MQIHCGLFSGALLQRNRRNRCSAVVRGESMVRQGRVYVAIDKRRWRAVGEVRRGRFTFPLDFLSAGGPYRVAVEVRAGGKVLDNLIVDDLLVGDLWLAAGQSNMQGCAFARYAAPVSPEIRAFYMNDCWQVASDPIHDIWQSVDPVNADALTDSPDRTYGVGPAVSFARAMHQSTGVPQGIIPCARGATSMQQWSPALPTAGRWDGTTLYSAMIRRFHKCGSSVAGMIWYQGESDAINGTADRHSLEMKQLIRALRRDTRQPAMPVVAVQIARTTFPEQQVPVAWNLVQEQQRQLPRHVRQLAVVPSIDISMDNPVHVGGDDIHRLADRMARAMQHLQNPRKQPAQIALGKVQIQPDETRLYANVVIQFENVQGKLQAGGGRATGFALCRQGVEYPLIFHTELAGNRVVLKTPLSVKKLSDFTLHYGLGCNPYCNITDLADRSLPVFGPVAL